MREFQIERKVESKKRGGKEKRREGKGERGGEKSPTSSSHA